MVGAQFSEGAGTQKPRSSLKYRRVGKREKCRRFAEVGRKKILRCYSKLWGGGNQRGRVRRVAPDLAHTARLKSQGHTHSVPPWWLKPGSDHADIAGPHRALPLPRPGCTGPLSTPPGTGSCRKGHRGAHIPHGHTWRKQRKGTMRTGQPRPSPKAFYSPPILDFCSQDSNKGNRI